LTVQASGGVDRSELDKALEATSLSIGDRIRLKSVLLGSHPIYTRRRT
jgi:hypothetical protein